MVEDTLHVTSPFGYQYNLSSLRSINMPSNLLTSEVIDIPSRFLNDVTHLEEPLKVDERNIISNFTLDEYSNLLRNKLSKEYKTVYKSNLTTDEVFFDIVNVYVTGLQDTLKYTFVLSLNGYEVTSSFQTLLDNQEDLILSGAININSFTLGDTLNLESSSSLVTLLISYIDDLMERVFNEYDLIVYNKTSKVISLDFTMTLNNPSVDDSYIYIVELDQNTFDKVNLEAIVL